MHPKIATCCYCGARAALRLDKVRHELTCSGCGAPLHDLKRMPVSASDPGPEQRSSGSQRKKQMPPPEYRSDYRRPKPRKRRKSFLRYALEEIVDVVEDIFD
ncbi:hypothetical protein [uncultured Roseobacter sp.]|uniref:hypothetical protein n=1 Tax=uncultured Roseobacter sp. TaxID=114847 RepID=UPI00262EF5A6|nr:hypothetical protein [uncultured Roseobacter sp.]